VCESDRSHIAHPRRNRCHRVDAWQARGGATEERIRCCGGIPGLDHDWLSPGRFDFPSRNYPPTFIWRDAAQNATRWRIDIVLADGSAGLHVQSAGEPLTIGEIDQRCVSATNELPKLTPEQVDAHTWIPEAGAWEAIKKHSVAGAATVTISGFTRQDAKVAASRGRVTIRTSKDLSVHPSFTATYR